MPSYFKCKKLGEGTYAIIYLAKEIKDGDSKLIKTDPGIFENYVAIKKIKKTKYAIGQEISAIREIKVMKELTGKFVLTLKDAFIHKDFIHLVLEFCDFDLESILKNKNLVLMPSDIKGWCFMLLRGLLELHSKFYIHRDIKPNNCLIKLDGTLKLADFGLTRKMDYKMTPQAITRWYRPPEMLFGAVNYTIATDMWSVGTVFAEMFLRVPFFAAETDLQQIEMIFRALGTPKINDWPEIKELPGYFEVAKSEENCIENLFSAVSSDAIDLLKNMLVFNPLKRISCMEALKHDYFKNAPEATEIGKYPVPRNDIK